MDVLTRHCFKDTDTCMDKNTVGKQFDVTGTGVYMHTYLDPTNYDAYDRSYDMVDVQVANGVFIFTIGLGSQTQASNGDINGYAPGETFLKYAAQMGGGIYRYSPGSAGLQAIFLEIANKIATKITK